MKKLRLLHLGLLFIIPIGYFILKTGTTDYDPVILIVDKLVLALGVIWSSYLAIELLKNGTNENLKISLINKYRELINNNLRFLIISNFILIISLCFLIYQFTFFKNVEFISDKDTELFQSNMDGTITEIGKISSNKKSTFRIKTGTKYLLFRESGKENFTAIPPVDIPPVYSNENIQPIKLIHNEKYETLK